jgi:hypothetical protein
MEENYRGYHIKIENRGLHFRVYISPTYPWFPILHCSHFDVSTTPEEALAEACREIDGLLDVGWRK